MTYGEFKASNSHYSVIFDEDHKVAYAYLLKSGAIISDVWLYNLVKAPEEPEWTDFKNAPFLNPPNYVRNSVQIPKPTCINDVTVMWEHNENLVTANIFIRATRFATLNSWEKPGRCLFAAKDGPLAKVLL